MKNVFLVIGISLLLACGFKNESIPERVPDTLNKSKEPHIWINSAYFDCVLNTSGPCNCLRPDEPLMLSITEDSPIIRVYEGDYSFEELYLKNNKNRLSVLTHPKATESIFEIKFNADTMYLINGDKEIIFYQSKQLDISLKDLDDPNLTGKLNLAILKKRLTSLGYNESEIIGVTTDSSYLNCNLELGGIDLISHEGKCDNRKIIEIRDKELYVYTYINSCEEKTINPKIEKTLFRRIPF